MRTIGDTAKVLGVSRDQIHYLIKTKFIQPHQEGKGYLLSDEEVEKIRNRVKEKTKPWGAIILMEVHGNHTGTAVHALKDKIPQVVWSAGAWGESSVVVFLEAPRIESLTSIPFDLGKQGYINYMRTLLIPADHYYVKDTLAENDRLAIVLINVENPPRNVRRVVEDLGDIPEVKRYGAIFGQWDCFAEVRYKDADDLFVIVMEKIWGFKTVTKTTTIQTMRALRREEPGFSAPSQPSEAVTD
jgi:DNA-binding Lrp family transcriptional regulator